MAQLEVPVSLREDIKDVIVEYISKRGFLDRDSYLFLIQLAGISVREGGMSKEDELKKLREMRRKELERALW
ncbi:MAG: hypothetical protein QXR97_06900 [Thermoproteota archaeon]